jgi:hypothetical protein
MYICELMVIKVLNNFTSTSWFLPTHSDMGLICL